MAKLRSDDALFDTIAAETRDTFAGAPRATLRPHASHETARRALEVLGQLAGASPTASLQLRPGDEIGRGGMGVIRAAEQVALGRTVAVKTVRPDHRDPDAALDLLREAWITGSLEHPNIVPVHHLGVDDRGLPLIVLKRIEGVAWADVLRDPAAVAQRIGTADVLAWNLGILLRVLDAVRFAHSRGIIHRDLKPSNVMIGDFGEVYLLDWGIAVSLRPDPTGRLPLASDARQIVGTPCYMAPEMLDTELALSERTDVYLAGAVLYELLVGKPPHLAATAVAAMTSVMRSQPELGADTPHELAAICRRAMQADPAQRFASADEMCLALQSYLDHRGSALLLVGAQARLGTLRAAIAAGDASEVHRIFGACRFGFHEALAAWPENADAHAGLAAATIAVAELELARDAPAAAVALLGELEPAPPLLAKAREAAERQALRRAELEQLEKAHDLSVNANARSALVAVLGAVFTLIPLVTRFVPSLGARDAGHFTVMLGVLFLVLTAVGLAAYRRFGTTEIDRRLILVVPFTFFMQFVLAVGSWLGGLSVAQIQVELPMVWASLLGIVALLVEPRFAPAAVGYIAAFCVAMRFPEYRQYAIAAGNALLTINATAWYRSKHQPTRSRRRASPR